MKFPKTAMQNTARSKEPIKLKYEGARVLKRITSL